MPHVICDLLGTMGRSQCPRRVVSAIAFEQQIVYAVRVLRKFPIAIVAVLSLLPAIAFAASAQAKRHVYHWHGYGFLPGYHQPPNNSVPIYGPRPSASGRPTYTPGYWYGDGYYYLGNPGFLRGHYNGGSFGPCWTWTPIGPIWNCG
jgi:hypothetical protein